MQLITLKEKKEEVKNLLNMDADFIVLDVDRTIINTTSWYQACMCPNLLIREEFTKDFKKIKFFVNSTEIGNSIKKKLHPEIGRSFLSYSAILKSKMYS